jgi:single-strand DNA-binding protein
MAGETTITVVGNLTNDPELRFQPSGAAVTNWTIASTPRVFKNNEWVDGDTLFMPCSIWRETAENVAETLKKGMRVIATGKLKQRSYEKDGQKRTVVELEVEEVGPSLKYSTAVVTRTQRNGQQGGQQGQPQAQPQQAPADNPWAPQGQPGAAPQYAQQGAPQYAPQGQPQYAPQPGAQPQYGPPQGQPQAQPQWGGQPGYGGSEI